MRTRNITLTRKARLGYKSGGFNNSWEAKLERQKLGGSTCQRMRCKGRRRFVLRRTETMRKYYALILKQSYFCILFALLLAAAGSAFGQTNEQQTAVPQSAPGSDTVSQEKIQGSYLIGADDVLEI